MAGESSIGMWMAPAVRAVAVHPSLWITGVRQAWRLRRRAWWRRLPFLPVPDRAYLELRSVTAYGENDRPPSREDVTTYLRWCRAWSRVAPRRVSRFR